MSIFEEMSSLVKSALHVLFQMRWQRLIWLAFCKKM